MKTGFITGYKNIKEIFITAHENTALFTASFALSGCILHFRTFCLQNDVQLLSGWLGTGNAKKFWDTDNSIAHLTAVYRETQGLSLMVLLNNKPTCFIEVYRVIEDELSAHVNCTAQDYGIHFLMAPVSHRIQHLSAACMQQCLRFLFSFTDVGNIYGEPDNENLAANALVKKVGFTFLKQQQLSYKTANIYICTRSSFNQQKLYIPGVHAC